MSLQKYLRTIKGIDPGKIYVENVRSIYNIPRFAARLICEMAVVDNIFIRKYGLVCPNTDCRRIIEEFDTLEEMPEEISCFICEAEDREVYHFKTSELEMIQFYKLKK